MGLHGVTREVCVVTDIRIVKVGHFLRRRSIQSGRAQLGHGAVAHDRDAVRMLKAIRKLGHRMVVGIDAGEEISMAMNEDKVP